MHHPLSSLKIGKWHGRVSIKQSLTRLKWKLTDDFQKNSAMCHSSNAVYCVNSPEFLKMSHLSELIKLMNLLQSDKLNGELEVFRSMLIAHLQKL